MGPRCRLAARCVPRRALAVRLLAVFVLALTVPDRGHAAADALGPSGLARQEGNSSLEERWREVRLEDDNLLRAAVIAAEDLQMPTQRCDAKLFHGKIRKSADGEWKVRWLNAQRQAAADLGHLFEIRWESTADEGSADHLSTPVRDMEELTSSLSRMAAGSAVRFTWALSRNRLVVGVVEDIVELGVGHVNLVTSTDEEVLIAGEGILNPPDATPAEPLLTVNFLSGTFTHPIVRKYLPGHAAHQEQWAPLMAEIFSVGGVPARVSLVDHGCGAQHFVGANNGTGGARQARILADSPWPTDRTKRSVCSPAKGRAWLRHCVCRRQPAEGDEESWRSWCDASEPCNLELCTPPTGSQTAVNW